MSEHERNRKTLLPSIIITGLFFIINLILILNHEPLATAKLWVPHPFTELINLVLITASVFLFTTFSNFKLFAKILIPLTAVFFYNNIIASSGNCLLIFAFSIFCTLFPRRKKYPKSFWLTLLGLIVATIIINFNTVTKLFGPAGTIGNITAYLTSANGDSIMALISSYLDKINLTIFGYHFPIFIILLIATLIYLLFKSPRLSFFYTIFTICHLALFLPSFVTNDYVFVPASMFIALPFLFTWLAESEDRKPKFIRKKIIHFFKNLELAKLLNGKVPGNLVIVILLALSIPQTFSYAKFDLTHNFSYSNTVTQYLNTLEPDSTIVTNINLYLTLAYDRTITHQGTIIENGTIQETFEKISQLGASHLYYIGSISTCAANAIPESWQKIAVFKSPNQDTTEPSLTLYKIKD